MSIKYALFPNHLTNDPDDYMAIVQDQASKTKEDIIDVMIGRGSTVTKAEALSVLEEFEAAIQEALEQGFGINTPLFRISASISGVFYNGDAFDRSKHYVRLNVNAGSRIGEIAANIGVEKVEASSASPLLTYFKDVASDSLNDTITSGGVGEITGSRLKVDTDDTEQGIYFIASDGTETPSPTIIRNKPSNLIFMIPAGLASGDYRLEVRAKSKDSKTLRAGSLDNLKVI